MRVYNIYIIAGLFFLLGIILAFFHEPHFYTFFSIGAFIILLHLYNKIANKKLFYYWRLKHFIIFYISLIAISIVIDYIGLSLGYWIYPHFQSVFDNILKYSFEWVIALLYHALILLIGVEIFKQKLGKIGALLLSLIIFIIPAGFLSEYLNLAARSWQVVGMPLTDYEICGFFIIFQTLGYWLMAFIPYALYKVVDNI